ncbi:MAG: amino acid permease [Phycisphaerales bacterium]
MATEKGPRTSGDSRRFGTFGGVFTPCVLTILGVIMFLRFGEVVGNAGIVRAIIIVLAAKLITLLTTLSLSAIATNTRTEAGGAYFLISRSLGVEFGGTIGLVFFVAQAISVALYVIGFSEAVRATVDVGLSLAAIATITNLVVFVCVFIGAGWAIKVQYGILAVLVASLISFTIGAAQQFDPPTWTANLDASYADDMTWVTMFALFFPAVTGIMAGANMSGDLRDPAKSIPRGTLLAVLFTGVIYLGLALLIGGVRKREVLQEEALVMADVAVVPWLITAGVFAATLSSALGSMMGAPRILQAFARDNVLPALRPFAKGSGPASEPRRATVVTAIIAQGCILLGSLDAIAPVITMAFMITYGTLNLATFYEAFIQNPSYRPRFRFVHWTVSLAGTVLCVAVMFMISWSWALLSIAGMTCLYYLISQREIEAGWGDLRSGLAFERVRRNLMRLEEELYHPKNWRPMLLTLGGASDTRRHLAVYGHWITASTGLQTVGLVIEGDVRDLLQRRANQRDVLLRYIREQEVSAFPAVVVSDSVRDGIVSLVQAHGLGGLEPNTVLIGWPQSRERLHRFCGLLRTLSALDRSVLIVKSTTGDETAWKPPRGTIDVWWRGRSNGELMLLLAHLLTRNPGWRGRRVRLMRVVQNEAAREEVMKHLGELIKTSRIDATPAMFVGDDPVAVIRRESRRAAIVLLGYEPPATAEDDSGFAEGIDRLTQGLNRVILVDSAGEVHLDH